MGRPTREQAEHEIRKCTRALFKQAANMLDWADENHPDSRDLMNPDVDLEFTRAAQNMLDEIMGMCLAFSALKTWRDESDLA